MLGNSMEYSVVCGSWILTYKRNAMGLMSLIWVLGNLCSVQAWGYSGTFRANSTVEGIRVDTH